MAEFESFNFEEWGIEDTDNTSTSAEILSGQSNEGAIPIIDDPNIEEFFSDDDKGEEETSNENVETNTEVAVNEEEVAQNTTAPKEEEQNIEINYSALVEDFFNMGILTKDGEESSENIKTPEDLKNRFIQEQQKGASREISKFLSQFGEKYIKAFEAIYVKGIDPETYFNLDKQIDELSDFNLETEDGQKDIVKKYYKELLGYNDDRSNKLVDMLVKSGEIDAEANVALERLQSVKELKIKEEEQRSEQIRVQKQQEEAYYNHVISNSIQGKITNKDIDGLPVNEEVLGTTLKNLTQKAWRLPNGETITDFENFLLSLKDPKNVDLAIKIDLLRQNNFDFSKIQKKAISDKSEALFSSLVIKDKTNSRKSLTEKTDRFKI